MSDLQVHYFASEKAWFTFGLLLVWFQKYFEPAVREYQIDSLKITGITPQAISVKMCLFVVMVAFV